MCVPSKTCLAAVAAGLVRGYHGWALGEDLSHIPLELGEVLDMAATSASAAATARVGGKGAGGVVVDYHPLQFCRLVGFLERI
ncbi:unnamed protein product [Choristocarpus tenellus]